MPSHLVILLYCSSWPDAMLAGAAQPYPNSLPTASGPPLPVHGGGDPVANLEQNVKYAFWNLRRYRRYFNVDTEVQLPLPACITWQKPCIAKHPGYAPPARNIFGILVAQEALLICCHAENFCCDW